MQYYFCFSAEERDQRKLQLKSAGIPHISRSNFETAGPGILVSERNALAALRVWRADVKFTDSSSRHYGRVKIITLVTGQVGSDAPHRVTVKNAPSAFNAEHQQRMLQAIASPLLPHVQTDILIRFCQGDFVDTEAYALERKFTIIFGGLRRHRSYTSGSYSPTVFGVRSTQSAYWNATDSANDFYDPVEKRCVAELWDNKLLIIHHNAANNAAIDGQVLQQLVARVVHHLSSGAVSIEDTLRTCMHCMQAEMLAYLQQTTAGRAEKRLHEAQASIAELRDECSNLRQELVQKARRLQDQLYLECVLTQTQNSASVETVAREFSALVAHPQVVNVLVTEQNLSIETSTVYCTEPNVGTRYELGCFTIEVTWDGSRAGNVKVLNRTRRTDGLYPNMHAPMVDADGRLLSKRYQESVPKLVAANAWSTILSLTLQCLETVDPNDPTSNYVKNWPLAAQEAQPAAVGASV